MHRKCLFAIFLAITVECIHSIKPENREFEVVKPSKIDELPNERRSIDFKERSLNNDDKRRNSEKSDSEKTKDSRQEKQTRTILPTSGTPDSGDKFINEYDQQFKNYSVPHCCGSRYEIGSPNRQESGQISGLRASSEAARFPSRYGSRPDDRYGWHSYDPESSGRRGIAEPSPSSVSGESHGSSPGDRYGTRPPPYNGGKSNYDRPGIGNRPGRPGAYGYGGNRYGDSGAYGSSGYEISRPGGGYGQRPPGSISFNVGRPGNGIYGGGHGIYGMIGEQEGELPGPEDGPDGGPPPPPRINNLQTQKAVALKALAGVALIGAAAALATNPVLLPIGMLAGRRKRSLNSTSEFEHLPTHKLTKLLENYPEFYREKILEEIVDSPNCVARLACEIQQEYKIDRKKNIGEREDLIDVHQRFNKRLVNSIQRKVLNAGIRYKNMKKVIKSMEPYRGNCEIFVCDLTH